MFGFSSNEDKRRILANGPWNYDDCLIAIEEPTGLGEVSTLKFNLASYCTFAELAYRLYEQRYGVVSG